MKIRLSTTLSLMILAAALAATGAHAERCLSVEPDSVLEYLGNSFMLDVAVNEEFDSLMGYNITVRFDKSFLAIETVVEGSLPAGSGFSTFFRWLNNGCGCDSIFVNGSILGNTVDGPGTLMRMQFKAIKAGITYVEIVRSDIRNGENMKLSHIRERAKIIIEPPINARGSSWGEIKQRYR